MKLLKKTKEICKDNNIKPARSYGQNFLINEDIYDFIVDSSSLSSNDYVLEVGPGLGFLTEKIAKIVKKVVAIDLDTKLVNVSKDRLKSVNNIKIINKNILDINLFEIKKWELEIENYKIIANLPYNITSVFLRKFLSTNIQPKEMTLMLQKEVAERIVAKPGKMSLLAVSVQFYAEAKILKYVSKTDFWPMPKVDSAIIQLRIKNKKSQSAPRIKISKNQEKEFFRMVKIGFSSKRKMLKNNLVSGYYTDEEKILEIFGNCNFNLKIRAQEFSLQNWFKLFGEIERNML